MLVTQLCLTLCDPTGYCPPGSSIHVIFQVRILKWVAISFSNEGISVLLRVTSKRPLLHVRTQRERPSAGQQESSRQNQWLAPRPWTSQPSDGESLLWKPPVFGELLQKPLEVCYSYIQGTIHSQHLTHQC